MNLSLNEPVPIIEQSWPEGTEPKVSVLNWVYNHKDYIKESIDGILFQKTTFPVEIIIQDDASNDGTLEIIKEYEILYPWLFNNILNKQNQYSQGNDITITLLKKPRGKYVALLHGDDYWTDPFKLQKQVDFLDRNSNYVLSFTKSMEYFQKENILIETKYPDELLNLSLNKLLSFGWFIRTSTILYRRDTLDLEFLRKIEYGPDYFIHLLMITRGKFHYLNDVTSVYRHHSEGVSKSNSEIYLERRMQFISNLELLNNYLEGKYSIEIMNEILMVKVHIYDYAILNRHFEYLRIIKFNEVVPFLFHVLNRIKNKVIRFLKRD